MMCTLPQILDFRRSSGSGVIDQKIISVVNPMGSERGEPGQPGQDTLAFQRCFVCMSKERSGSSVPLIFDKALTLFWKTFL